MGKKKTKEKPPLRLDFGCGPHKREGFTGVDVRKFPGVDIVRNVAKGKWPWKDGSVDEAHCSHMLEHLTWPERVHFLNELHRVLKPGGQCQIIIPHWASSRYYGDPTHKEPMSEFAFMYLNADWRKTNAPHTDYTCDFGVAWGYNLHPTLQTWNEERRMEAVQWFKEAAMDTVATLTKK